MFTYLVHLLSDGVVFVELVVLNDSFHGCWRPVSLAIELNFISGFTCSACLTLGGHGHSFLLWVLALLGSTSDLSVLVYEILHLTGCDNSFLHANFVQLTEIRLLDNGWARLGLIPHWGEWLGIELITMHFGSIDVAFWRQGVSERLASTYSGTV